MAAIKAIRNELASDRHGRKPSQLPRSHHHLPLHSSSTRAEAAAAAASYDTRETRDSGGCCWRSPGVATAAPLPLNYIDVVTGGGSDDEDRSERRPKCTAAAED